METPIFRKTHPLVLGAAASVMVVSLLGAAAIGGLPPNARSDKTDTPAPRSTPVAGSLRDAAPLLAARDNTCVSCGTVETIHEVKLKGNATGLGAIAGGVIGNTIGKNVDKRYSYRVRVRMDDGTFRAVSQIGAPSVEVGARVRVTDGTLFALS